MFLKKILFSSGAVFSRRLAKDFKHSLPLFNASRNFDITQENLLQEAIHEYEKSKNVNWDEVKTNVLKSGKFITKTNIDAMTLGLCISGNNYKAGKAYFQYLNDEGKNDVLSLNLAAVGKFFRLFYVMKTAGLSTEADEKEVLEFYDKLRKKYELLNASTAEYSINVLSQTSRWKECLELLDMIKITAKPSVYTNGCVVEAAFKNNDDQVGWELLERMLAIEQTPADSVFLSCVKNCASKNVQNFEKLLNIFGDYDVKPSKEVTEAIAKAGRLLKFVPYFTRMNRRGFCENCNASMQKVDLKPEEFSLLKSNLIQKVIVGKDVHLKSSPEEFKRFNDFIDSINGKFNVVIDGLNVAYSAGVRQSPSVNVTFLEAVVRYWKEQRKNVLVLGRKHMVKWPRMDYVKRNAILFLAQDLSHDDPLLLYCALSGEPGTQIVSRDMMRSHSYLLADLPLQRLFKRWLLQCRHEVVYVDLNTKKVTLKHPPAYLPSAQTSNGHWHVPYSEISPSGEEKPGSNWLCLRKSPKTAK